MEVTNNIKTINTKVNISDIIKIISTIVAVVGATTFFIYKMQSLPPRVDKLEQDLNSTRKELTYQIDNLKSEMNKSSAKQDIIIDDLKLIKNHLLRSSK